MIITSIFKVQRPRLIKVLIIIWNIANIMIVIGLIFYLIFNNEDDKVSLFCVYESFCLFMLLCSGYLYIESKYVYIIVGEDGLIISNIKRKKYISFNDIKYVNLHHIYNHVISCFDDEGKLLFSINYNFVGSDRLNLLLKEKNYDILPDKLRK